jgi:2-hydroxychromene-2-carboxylate isomerase
MRAATGEIEVFFDCSSPWTYLAFENLQPLAAELGAAILWRPILVGGVFNTVNPSVYESRAAPVPVKMPPTVFPVNSVKAMRACLVVAPEGKLVDFARAVFQAYWSEDQDISQDAVLDTICRRLDLRADVLARAADPGIKAALKTNTDELIARGGFGSPTMFVNGADMYFGNDRLELVRAALTRA